LRYKIKKLQPNELLVNFTTIEQYINVINPSSKGSQMSEDNESNIERRQSFRLDMEEELVDMHYVDNAGNEQQKKIACLDFSRGGLRLSCEYNIPLQTAVTIIFKAANPNSQRLLGKVIRCISQKSGNFEIALRLDDETIK
jgi:c-di-GMP-binding flagellar brake protein YcgR